MIATGWNRQVNADRTMGVARRVVGALLLLVMAVGSFALWLGVPAVVLWGIGKLASDSIQHLILGLIGVPLGMIVFGLLLAMVNTAYLRLSGVAVGADDADDWKPRIRGPLDRIIGISAAVCLVAFLAWLVFGSAGVGPAGP